MLPATNQLIVFVCACCLSYYYPPSIYLLLTTSNSSRVSFPAAVEQFCYQTVSRMGSLTFNYHVLTTTNTTSADLSVAPCFRLTVIEQTIDRSWKNAVGTSQVLGQQRPTAVSVSTLCPPSFSVVWLSIGGRPSHRLEQATLDTAEEKKREG